MSEGQSGPAQRLILEEGTSGRSDAFGGPPKVWRREAGSKPHSGASSVGRCEMGDDEASRGNTNEIDEEREARLLNIVSWHLLPIHFTLAMCCYIDRTNLSFAALQMNDDLSFGPAEYGMGAAIFFISYTMCQIPSNMVIARVGAPRWLALILATWGILAACMAFIDGTGSFLVMRLLLGAAEAGTFPGIWFHLAQFYPPRHVGEAYTKVATVTAVSAVVGGPLAALLMQLDGAMGLRGWQWLFLLEGIPTALMSIAVLTLLPRSPREAKWLSDEDREWLTDRSAGQRTSGPTCKDLGKVMKLKEPWHLGTIWGLAECSMYGCQFWIPLIIRRILGLDAKAGPEGHASASTTASDVLRVSFVSAIPFFAATAAMLYVARLSSARDERKMHTVVPLIIGAVFLGVATPLTASSDKYVGITMLSIAMAAIWAIHGPVMSLAAVIIPPKGRAAGVALVNSVGAVGGFLGPYMIGILSEGGSYNNAMAALGLFLAISAGLGLFLRDKEATMAHVDYARVEELPETPSVTGDLRRDRPIPGAIKWKASQPRLNSRSGSHSSLSDGRQSAPPQFVRMSEAVAGEV